MFKNCRKIEKSVYSKCDFEIKNFSVCDQSLGDQSSYSCVSLVTLCWDWERTPSVFHLATESDILAAFRQHSPPLSLSLSLPPNG